MSRLAPRRKLTPSAQCYRAKFLGFFPDGFRDETYIDWERGYKWEAHEKWQAQLGKLKNLTLLRDGNFHENALIAVQIESRTNLLFSFEKMALRAPGFTTFSPDQEACTSRSTGAAKSAPTFRVA